jgi:hypothetical protein
MNREGVTAYVDCMLFLMVIMIAIAVTITFNNQSDEQDCDPDDFLSRLSKTEVRLSDFTDIEDDTLVYIADVMAFDTSNDTEVRTYLDGILEKMFGKHRYALSYSYLGNTIHVGDMEGFHRFESSRAIRISNGGTIDVSVRLM